VDGRDPWREYKVDTPLQQQADYNRRRGHWKIEASVKVKTLVKWFKKLFGR
jgi:hypothetical protein